MKKLTRGEYIVPGPNHLWAIDGHDKLAKYGIEIYAAIDAYSRHIQWFYVGNSNRTQLSVARQFLDAIKALDICPDFIRSDHGTETPLLADAQFSLYKAKLRQEGASEEELQAVQLRGCYWYGVSVRNVKIEGLWRQLIQQSTMAWMNFFTYLAARGFFESELVADKAVLQFVFIPILRSELQAFVRDHNEHRIRRDKKRANHVPGRPNDLYNDRPLGEIHGFSPDLTQLSILRDSMPTWDIDAYLAEDTLAWCQQAIGDHIPRANEFLTLPDRQQIIPVWYQQLLAKAREHQRSGEAPRFAFVPKPRKRDGWIPHPAVTEALEEGILEEGLDEEDDEADEGEELAEDFH